jgi:hypothetical protein
MMKKNFLAIFIVVIISLLLFLPVNPVRLAKPLSNWVNLAEAAGEIRIENPLQAETFEELLSSLINFVFYVAMAVTPIMIMIAGFFLLTAGGSPERVETAKKIILWTVIGLAIILLARGLISVLEHILGVPPPQEPPPPPSPRPPSAVPGW